MFTIHFEADCGILCLEVYGCWDLATVRRYAATMVKEAGIVTQLEGRLKLLARVVDRSFATPEAATELRRMVKTIAASTPDSRIALLVKSTFLKGQTGVDLDDGVKAFESEQDARAWLTAYDCKQQGLASEAA